MSALRNLFFADPLGLVVAACSASAPVQPGPDADRGGSGGGGGAGGSGGSFVCPDSGVDKGPWTLAVDGTSAKIRWEIGDTNPGLGTYAHDVLAHALPKNPGDVAPGKLGGSVIDTKGAVRDTFSKMVP